MKKYTALTMPSMADIRKLKKPFIAASTFSGMGGSSIGMQLAGFNVKYANEFIPIARDTYKANSKAFVDDRDIRKVKPEEILKHCGVKRGELDLFEGSPPCFPTGTLIYTSTGYVAIENVRVGDLVLTHNGRFRKVTDTMSHYHRGSMYHLQTPGGFDTSSTGEHPYYVRKNSGGVWDIAAKLSKPQWLAADAIEETDFVAVPKDFRNEKYVWSGIRCNEVVHKVTKEIVKYDWAKTLPVGKPEFWWVVGRWVGDGWMRYHRPELKPNEPTKRRSRACVLIAADRTDSGKELGDVLAKVAACGIDVGYVEGRTAYKIGFGNREWCEFLMQFGRGAGNKKVPGFVQALPKKLLREFYEGYISADGSARGGSRYKFSTVSKELALGMAMVIQKLFNAHVRLVRGYQHPSASIIEGRKVNVRPIHTATWNEDFKGEKQMCVKSDKHLWVPVRKITKERTACRVYNISVAQDESYVADGYVVHNCKAFSATQMSKKGSLFGKEIPYSDGVKQRVDDLFFEYTRLLNGLKPRIFVAENVPGLLSDVNRGIYLEVFEALTKAGYRVKSAVIDPIRLGCAQSRKRLIFIGVRKDLKLDPEFPMPIDANVYVSDLLPQIAKLKIGKKFKPAASNFSPTITAADRAIGFTADFSAGGFVETQDGEIRKYTIAELKKLSTVPKDFKMCGTFQQKWERLGRIHLPLAMYYVASAMREQVLEKL